MNFVWNFVMVGGVILFSWVFGFVCDVMLVVVVGVGFVVDVFVVVFWLLNLFWWLFVEGVFNFVFILLFG